MVLVITTILDTATVPFLGFAFFIIGYPKPIRGWSNSVPAMPQFSDKRSDAFLYESMKVELAQTLRDMDSKDSNLFQVGHYFMLKNEKMLMLIQILEKGQGYMIYSVKGSELNETTICHAEELEFINQVDKEVFEEK